MKKVLILVEGETEEAFVNQVLSLHLIDYNVVTDYRTLVTSFDRKRGKKHTGGVTSYARIERDLINCFHDASATLVTTMLDFYHFPDDAPGLDDLEPDWTCYEKVEYLEAALKTRISRHITRHDRFLPYLMLHEFEAMLFTSPQTIVSVMNDTSSEEALLEILEDFESPEEINTENPPGKRLETVFQTYRKRIHGPQIAGKIGLEAIRAECTHFNQWLTQLEKHGEQ